MSVTIINGEQVYESKEFDQEALDKYDLPARLTLAHYLKTRKFPLPWMENPNTKDIDFILPDIGFMEVEVKTTWVGHDFTWPDMQVSWRKGKYISPHTVFVLFNVSLNRLAAFPSEFVRPSFETLDPRIRRCKNTNRLEKLMHTDGLDGIFWDDCEPQVPFN